jgi:hypothetical protein
MRIPRKTRQCESRKRGKAAKIEGKRWIEENKIDLDRCRNLFTVD